MILGDLVKYLADLDPSITLKRGFKNPHSYRGDYYQLGVEPAENVTVESMLAAVKLAMGSEYNGWKGGEFRMHEYTDVYLAEWGSSGEALTPAHLELWLLEVKLDEWFNQFRHRLTQDMVETMESILHKA